MTLTSASWAPASTAASSAPEPPRVSPSCGVCAIHQPNLFPRLPTLAKLFAADRWIVLDDVRFARGDYQHRARLAALDDPGRQQWPSLPTHLPHGAPPWSTGRSWPILVVRAGRSRCSCASTSDVAATGLPCVRFWKRQRQSLRAGPGCLPAGGSVRLH
ncbi:WbqC family protein [Streptomyces sp. NPDC057403]|uniref:WbqC family protein n=1 Tax=Streptomyces sp. NPDC057403 TaxID=3346119 RepID=UPI00369988D5